MHYDFDSQVAEPPSRCSRPCRGQPGPPLSRRAGTGRAAGIPRRAARAVRSCGGAATGRGRFRSGGERLARRCAPRRRPRRKKRSPRPRRGWNTNAATSGHGRSSAGRARSSFSRTSRPPSRTSKNSPRREPGARRVSWPVRLRTVRPRRMQSASRARKPTTGGGSALCSDALSVTAARSRASTGAKQAARRRSAVCAAEDGVPSPCSAPCGAAERSAQDCGRGLADEERTTRPRSVRSVDAGASARRCRPLCVAAKDSGSDRSPRLRIRARRSASAPAVAPVA